MREEENERGKSRSNGGSRDRNQIRENLRGENKILRRRTGNANRLRWHEASRNCVTRAFGTRASPLHASTKRFWPSRIVNCEPRQINCLASMICVAIVASWLRSATITTVITRRARCNYTRSSRSGAPIRAFAGLEESRNRERRDIDDNYRRWLRRSAAGRRTRVSRKRLQVIEQCLSTLFTSC